MIELRIGTTVTTPGRTIGEGDISLFAGLAGDFTPIHVDEEFASASPHGARIAHGPLTLATAIGMATQTGMFGSRVIGLVNLNWDFMGVVKIGDTIRSTVTVETLRPTSKPGRSLGAFRFEVFNQHRAVVQRGTMTVVLRDDEAADQAVARQAAPGPL